MNVFVMLLISILQMQTQTQTAQIYPDAGIVTCIKGDSVTYQTANGNLFSFYGSEDWQVGDAVAVLMYNNGTDTINDDVILQTKYVGYIDAVITD